MQITVIVQSANSEVALGFVRAALAAHHEIPLVFFFQDGVFAVDAARSGSTTRGWRDLHQQAGLRLGVCIGGCNKRTLVDAGGHSLPGIALDPGFDIVGLGQLVGAMMESDRVVTFAA